MDKFLTQDFERICRNGLLPHCYRGKYLLQQLYALADSTPHISYLSMLDGNAVYGSWDYHYLHEHGLHTARSVVFYMLRSGKSDQLTRQLHISLNKENGLEMLRLLQKLYLFEQPRNSLLTAFLTQVPGGLAYLISNVDETMVPNFVNALDDYLSNNLGCIQHREFEPRWRDETILMLGEKFRDAVR